MMELGTTLRMIRLARGLSAKVVSEDAEISPAFLSLIESGARAPSISVMHKLAHALSVSPDVLAFASQPQRRRSTAAEKPTRIGASLQQLRRAERMLQQALEMDAKAQPRSRGGKN